MICDFFIESNQFNFSRLKLMNEPTKIVIVEDERIIALDIKNSLKKFGYEVPVIFSSGEKLLEEIEEIQPDLVLMDVQLKGKLDGVQTAEIISSQFQLPVVFLTAHTDEVTLQRVKGTYPFGYIVKPFEERDLYATTEIALARAKAEAEIRKSLEKERELNELKSRFVSMVSHEFRTPLATILFSAGLLENYSHKWTEEKKLTHLMRIQTAVKQMASLLEDILIIGKAEAGKLEFQPESIHLENFCCELVEEAQMMYQYPHHQIIFTCNNHKNEVRIDEKLLRQILLNLLSNSIKYSPKGGVINFSLWVGRLDHLRTSEPFLQLTSESIYYASAELPSSQEVAIFHIQDEGIGIPPEDQQRMFEMFHRATNVGTISGTGLGLAIVKRSVELHQGTIEVKSQLDVGTAVIVTLPLSV